jgi:hypothetical protein
MKTLYKYLTIVLALTTSELLGQQVEMADKFREEGKIYVVVAIVLVVLAGLITYLFVIDRKVTKLERRLGSRQQPK